MLWATWCRFVMIIVIPCLIHQTMACGGATMTTRSGSGISTENDSDNNSQTDTTGATGDAFGEEEQFQSFLMINALLATLSDIDLAYLVVPSSKTSYLSTVTSNCSISGNFVASSSTLDFETCVFDSGDYRYLLSGSVDVTSEDDVDTFTYNLGINVLGDNVDYVFVLTGDVIKTLDGSTESYEVNLDTALNDHTFGLNGDLTTNSEAATFTGSISILFDTLFNSCGLVDYSPNDWDNYLASCEF